MTVDKWINAVQNHNQDYGTVSTLEKVRKEYKRLQKENELLQQYKKDRDRLLSANVEKSNLVESAFAEWARETHELRAENELLKKLNDLFRERLTELGDIDILSQIEIYNQKP